MYYKSNGGCHLVSAVTSIAIGSILSIWGEGNKTLSERMTTMVDYFLEYDLLNFWITESVFGFWYTASGIASATNHATTYKVKWLS